MERVHKAVRRFTLNSELTEVARQAYGSPPPTQTIKTNMGPMSICLGDLYRQQIEKELADIRRDCMARARADLEAAGRADHLLNLYIALDHVTGVVSSTWTFSDPDTALMFKLALS